MDSWSVCFGKPEPLVLNLCFQNFINVVEMLNLKR